MSVSDMQDAARSNGARVEAAAEEAAAEVKTRAERAKQALQDTARKGADAARQHATAASRRMSELTQARPMESLSGALALGLLAGFTIGLLVGRATAD